MHLKRKIVKPSTLPRKGTSLALVVVTLPIIILLCGFAINVAQMQLTRTELQVSTDASARAAGRIYSTTRDVNLALGKANELGQYNLVSGRELQFSMDDLELGISTRADAASQYEFTPGGSNQNALRLHGRKTSESLSGPVNFLFPLFTRKNFETSISAVSTQVELDIAIVLDRSGSMAYADNEEAIYPPIPAAAPSDWDFGDPAPPQARWYDAVNATGAFLNRLDDSPQLEKVSLVTYADYAVEDVALSFDYGDVLDGLRPYTTSLGSAGTGTNISDGIRVGSDSLSSVEGRDFAAKVIIIMTDGRYNLGGWPPGYAKTASKDGVMIFTVTFSDEADTGIMNQTASYGGGKHFHARSGADLVAVFEEIAKNLPTLITK